jgi:hypothetical protein
MYADGAYPFKPASHPHFRNGLIRDAPPCRHGNGRIALGPDAGARVWRLGDDPDAPWVRSTVPRHAHLAGFDLHASAAVPAADRARLEQLCRYLLRPAVAQDWHRRLADGRVVLMLKSAWADGTRHLLLEPLTFSWPRGSMSRRH